MDEQNSSLKKFFFGKISRKMIFLFVVTAIIATIMGSLIFYNITMNNAQSLIKAHLETAAESRAQHIVTYFDQDIERINLITSRTQMRLDIENYLNNQTKISKERVAAKLLDSKSSIEEIEHICFINLDGNVGVCDGEFLEGQNYGGEDFFINGKNKEGAYFFKINNGWRVIISGPIYQSGKLMGVIITTELFDELEDIVQEKTGFGETGELLVAFKDKSGTIIYPLPRRFETSSTLGVTAEPMINAVAGKSLFFQEVLDYRGVSVLAVSKFITSVKLGLVAKIDESEAIGVIQQKMQNTFLIIAFFIIFSVSLVGYFVARAITLPISELTFATEKLQNKDFKVRVNINSGDEFQQLGASFNKTIEILDNLEVERNQIDKAKTEFLSITSHELRSPMTPMKAQLQMLLADYFGKMSKEQKDSLKIVLNNTERLDKILVDFLEISRIEAARLKFNFVRADLSKMISSVVEEMKGFMPEKKITIETKIGKLPVIECDPDRISQVLRNLINNAIKFTPNNGKIEISAKTFDSRILFSVKDNGVGIAQKDQRKLFEPFYQVDNMYQHKSGGSGLGLAISKGIVESQNGKIWLVSEPGKGTVFYFTVPLKPVREVKAIKLLFSDSGKLDELLKGLFLEHIGPLGASEFEKLRDSEGLTFDSISNYISSLIGKSILEKELGEEFKNKVSLILKGEEKEGKEMIGDLKNSEEEFISAFDRAENKRKEINKINLEDLRKKGLIK